MRSRPGYPGLIVLSSLTYCLAIGCINIGDLAASDIISGLSDLILRPDQTCEQLRERYQLTYLPIADNPAEVGMQFEEHWLPVDEQTSLRAWYLPTRLDRGTVVVSCGNAGPMACYLFTAELLTRNGWSVVMYEYEGYGLSAGQPSLATLNRDLEAVVEWTRGWTAREKLTLMGLSLGSIPSVALAVERPDAVNGVILDSPIALSAQIQRFGFLVGGRTDLIIAQLDVELFPDYLIQWLYQPLLVFLHERDGLATPETVEWLYEQAPGPKQLVRFAGLDHARGQFFSTDVYLSHLELFLADVWSQSEEQRRSAGRSSSSRCPPRLRPWATQSARLKPLRGLSNGLPESTANEGQ